MSKIEFMNDKVIRLPKPNYEYITDKTAAKKAVAILEKCDVLGMDIETTSLDVIMARTVLIQLATPSKSYIFDVRNDTDYSDVTINILKPILTNENILKILQNAVYDMQVIKNSYGFYLKNVYDTMLVDQILNLGLPTKSSLAALALKYLGITLEKEPGGTFGNYYQKYTEKQKDYAANDALILHPIRDHQIPMVLENELVPVCELEFNFLKPMCEMQLNGIELDVSKWRAVMSDFAEEAATMRSDIEKELSVTNSQTSLFGVPMINIDSNKQLKIALNSIGFNLENTSEPTLKKLTGHPLIDKILKYRKANKLVSTYGESLINQIHPTTGRLHTSFKQMVSTGRMSSSNPNLQNIPKKQKFRNCFIAKKGYSLVTCDMSSAELKILGNLSKDPEFIQVYEKGLDLHTESAAKIYGIPPEEVTKDMRGAAKALSFGLCYGLSKYGLAARLKISEKEAQNIIDSYFKIYKGVKKLLDGLAKEAVYKRYSKSIIGRKRFYSLPNIDDPSFDSVKRSIERKGMNMPIQSSNADTLKQAIIYLIDRLENSEYDAKVLLVVHDEVIVEVREDQREAVAEIVERSIIDGFNTYFSLIPMTADSLISPAWMKDSCGNKESGSECGHTEFERVLTDDKFGSKIVCKKCGFAAG